MKQWIPFRLAGNLLLVAFGLLLIFHLLIMAGVVPSEIVWGGQIGASATNFWVLEIFALVTTVIFALIVAAKMNYILAGRYRRAITIGLWLVFAYLALNTIGNLASGVTVEKLLFTPVTVVLALCALRLALEPDATTQLAN